MAEQVFVFCSNYCRELETLNLKENYGDVEVIYIPSRCGMPLIEWSTLQEKLTGLGDYQELHVASCGGITGLPGKWLIAGSSYNPDFKQCSHMVIGPDMTEYYIQKGYYLVTPGWLSHWRGTLEGWGFDQPTAVNFFKDTTRSILLLDTGIDPTAEANLSNFAHYIERPHEQVIVGLDYLKLLLDGRVLKARADSSVQAEKEKMDEKQKELADFAMMLDLLNNMARIREEEFVLENIKNVFRMLFAPREVNLRLSVHAGPSGYASAISDTDSFSLAVQGSSGLLGMIDIIGVNQPRYLPLYKKMADRIANICGLAIENARYYKTIKDLSATDGLTGVANRRKLEEHLDHEWRRLLREGKPLAMMMCDIDYFKHYNDLYGHQAGDDCLKAVAAVLANHSQRSGDLAARYGGEEFTLVLPAVDKAGAAQLAEIIRQDIEALNIKHDGSPVSGYVTLSIGVCCRVPVVEITVDKMVAAADKALYDAKAGGRNRVVMA